MQFRGNPILSVRKITASSEESCVSKEKQAEKKSSLGHHVDKLSQKSQPTNRAKRVATETQNKIRVNHRRKGDADTHTHTHAQEKKGKRKRKEQQQGNNAKQNKPAQATREEAKASNRRQNTETENTKKTSNKPAEHRGGSTRALTQADKHAHRHGHAVKQSPQVGQSKNVGTVRSTTGKRLSSHFAFDSSQPP